VLIFLDVVAASSVPVVSEMAGLAVVVMYAVDGDWIGAGLAVVGIAPAIGTTADFARLARLKQLKRSAITSAERADQSVLGHYPAYKDTAERLGGRHFNVPSSVWNRLTAAEQWAANKKFLDRLIARGDTVILATPMMDVRAGSSFARELDYLIERGYRIAEDGTRMLPPGP
jgi:hypothetical protein